MDAAGVGALIGFASLLGCFLLVKCNDILERRNKNTKKEILTTPLLLPSVIQIQNPVQNSFQKKQWKVNLLPVPSAPQIIKVSSLSSTTSIRTTS